MSKKNRQEPTIAESCEGILAVLKAGQRQLEYLAHEHLEFRQVLKIEQALRVGSSPERAEIQRMRLLLDARLDHVQQMRAMSSLAPLTLTPMDKKRYDRVLAVTQPSSPEETETAPPRPSPTPLETAAVPEVTALEAPDLPAPKEAKPAEDASPTSLDSQPPSPVASSASPMADSSQTILDESPLELSETEAESPQTEDPTTPASEEPAPASPIPLGGIEVAPASSSGLSIQVRPANHGMTESKDSDEKPLDDRLKVLMSEAASAHSEGELERAIEAYSDLLDQVDEHLPALLARGRCLLEMKDHSAALSDFRRAQRSSETHPAPLVAMGDLFMARKEHTKAIEFFDQAIALQPEHPQARCRRGLAHYHCGRFRQAFLDLQRAYKLDPEIPNIRRLVQMAIRKLEESE